MTSSRTTPVTVTVAEMREFASFRPSERAFIEEALDVWFHGASGLKAWVKRMREDPAWRQHELAYRELRTVRELVPSWCSLSGVETFMGLLTRVSAQDLAREQLATFSAYRFLYERLLGARARPWLPSAFCGAAALPQIRPAWRKVLLGSISEAAALAPAWSETEPSFFPERMEADAGAAARTSPTTTTPRPSRSEPLFKHNDRRG